MEKEYPKGLIEVKHPTFRPSRTGECIKCGGSALIGQVCVRCIAYPERLGQIQNFEHLLETLESGDIDTACLWIRAAIKKLKEVDA